MSITLDKKYNGDGGNEQRVSIKDSTIGWKAILDDPNRHLSNGVTQYDYVDKIWVVRPDVTWNNYLNKWDHTNEDNLDFEDAVSREASREMWRSFYKRNFFFVLPQIQLVVGG